MIIYGNWRGWYEHKGIMVIKQKGYEKNFKINLEMGHNRISKVGVVILKS